MKLDNYVVPEAPRLGFRGWLRWIWRQVTSMRVALILLLVLALASIPGSVLPQWPQDAAATAQFVADHAFWGPLLDATGFLDVFGSAWFTAIYVLLFASLIGCITPRAILHYRELRRPVAPAPSRLSRYEPVDASSPLTADDAVEAARAALRPRAGRLGALTGSRVRVDRRDDGTVALAAETGHIRELGNLVFHASLVLLLVAMAYGTLFTYRGQAIVVEGRSFTNAVVAYDTFDSGRLFDPASLDPFTIRLDSFDAEFSDTARPLHFQANVTFTEPGGEPVEETISVNHPLEVDGAKVYLQGNGYAPVITVRDAAGEIAFSGPVPFLPQDAVYTSTGVIKAPDVSTGEQLGFTATLYPTFLEGPFAVASIHPDPTNPVIDLLAYVGDLGLDTGIPQNVYRLDQSQLSPVRGDDGQPALLRVNLGETVDIPGGLGTVTFESLPRFVALDLRADPSLPYLLTAAILTLLGLSVSLFAPRRKVWVVAREEDGTTVVTVAALAPAHDAGVQAVRERASRAATGEREPE
ncbi:cytochrome c biogenesis protein ResB [Demequina sp. SYSU T00039]|uniref:Cytochrome c biogenesis protein ResB n=1 Tax=Demequina lignilytica TaxID=3051663 RepID=A0AAW7M3V6_9MICO|nr:MULTISPECIES: cytochrome c biogenesis protein ResB [unclassified Demequina]MDN4478016.1 cytochrome c biogenesis protein ResB [Demequina sp. SYSU T00039-1]MDN4488534.1 cytochrome c biogenesis protein ResB [Demequina sp. SYSU T00039]MDN4489919.1 cytochrome c biogenesis protein ResB [Demequina sp. SYSU T00068]